jgi:hypothetical protein
LSLLVSHWRASSYVQHPERAYWNAHSTQGTIWRSRWLFSTTAELTIRGGGKQYSNMALMPTERMGPPPGASPPMRMTASWSGSNDPTAYKSVARSGAPMASSPRILNRPTDKHRPEPEARQKARLAVHHRSACSGLKALRNTSAAKRQAAKLCYPFRSLDPFRALREPDRRRRDEERLPAPNKEPAIKPKTTT